MIKVCVAGITGWTGSAVARAVMQSATMAMVAAVSRKEAGSDIGKILGLEPIGKKVSGSIEEALLEPVDVLIDYTAAVAVKHHVEYAFERNVRVVVGSSGLKAEDFIEFEKVTREKNLGLIAAGNFSITAAIAKRCALLAAEFLPTREIIEYADDHKPDAPGGTTRELAEALDKVKPNQVRIAIDSTGGIKSARGATVAGTQIHSIRLPGYYMSFETQFGLPGERLSIKHDAGTGAEPYVQGTLLAVQKVMNLVGVIRGMDNLLFETK